MLWWFKLYTGIPGIHDEWWSMLHRWQISISTIHPQQVPVSWLLFPSKMVVAHHHPAFTPGRVQVGPGWTRQFVWVNLIMWVGVFPEPISLLESICIYIYTVLGRGGDKCYHAHPWLEPPEKNPEQLGFKNHPGQSLSKHHKNYQWTNPQNLR